MAGTSTRTTALTVRFPNDLLAELRAIAVRRNLSVSRVVTFAIRIAMDSAAENSEHTAVGAPQDGR
jgi:post-segregation antitoxin (ccd killing protein)